MLFWLFAWMIGYYEFRLFSPLKASNRYLKGRLSLFGFHREKDCAIGYALSFRCRRVKREIEAAKLSAERSRIQGLPAVFRRNCFRVGALVGIGFGIFLSVLSGQYIWQIDVVGNERLRDEEILRLLQNEGVYEGAYHKSIDALAVANRILAKTDTLAFLGVNIVGNRVEAVVMEHHEKDLPRDEDLPSNIVAAKNGVVVSVLLEGGVTKLKAGDTVSKGELLISGVNLLHSETYHYQRAKGQVLARTLNEISLSAPRYRYEKEYTGRIFEEKELIFFTKSKKLSKECGNLPTTCDRIETRERVMLFGRIPLPLWLITVSYREFTLDEILLDEQEAIRVARQKILKSLSSKPLVSYKEDVTLGEDSVTLSVIYQCIEDIALEYPLFDLP